jgi:hypothetical protein
LLLELRKTSEETHFHLGTSYADEYPEDQLSDFNELFDLDPDTPT